MVCVRIKLRIKMWISVIIMWNWFSMFRRCLFPCLCPFWSIVTQFFREIKRSWHYLWGIWEATIILCHGRITDVLSEQFPGKTMVEAKNVWEETKLGIPTYHHNVVCPPRYELTEKKNHWLVRVWSCSIYLQETYNRYWSYAPLHHLVEPEMRKARAAWSVDSPAHQWEATD